MKHPPPWRLIEKSDLDWEYYVVDANGKMVMTISEAEPSVVDEMLSTINQEPTSSLTK